MFLCAFLRRLCVHLRAFLCAFGGGGGGSWASYGCFACILVNFVT